MDMIKNVELNSAAQETNALVPADNALSAAVQQPAAPAPADTEALIETIFVAEKEQIPAAAPASEKKEEKAKTKKHRKTNHCRENHKDKQLIVTKETSKPGTEAFNELMEKRKLYPDYTIVYRSAKPSENRLSVKDLTAEKMEKFIKLSHPGDEKRMKEFNLQNQLSELYPTPITYLRNWFRRNYREYWTNAKKAANA